MSYLFPPPEVRTIPVTGQDASYPIHRIFCVGRNYAAHAAEMGVEADHDAPFFFTKAAQHAAPSGVTLPYPPGTRNYHFEMELAVALGAPVFRGDRMAAGQAVYALGCALDMTRRDLQLASRSVQRPWDFGKDVEGSAVFAPMTRATDLDQPPGTDVADTIAARRIWLTVNGTTRQESTLGLMIHDVASVISYLSGYYHLGAGDVILTGTPDGVGPVTEGDRIDGGIDGLAPVRLSIGPAA